MNLFCYLVGYSSTNSAIGVVVINTLLTNIVSNRVLTKLFLPVVITPPTSNCITN